MARGRNKLECTKCGREIEQILYPNLVGESWRCEEHGKQTQVYITPNK